MFTGDNVLGHGTAVFEDLALYLRSLELMSQQFSGRAYPAHGALITNGRDRVREYIVHRQRREEEVLEVLRHPHAGPTADDEAAFVTTKAASATSAASSAAEAWTPMEIVKIIYADVSPTLHDAAAKGILQMLRKLSLEGKVVSVSVHSDDDDDYDDDDRGGREDKWQITPKAGL